MTRHFQLILIALLALCAAAHAEIQVSSPNRHVRIELLLQQDAAQANVPRWRAFLDERPIVLSSRLGVDLADGTSLGGPCDIQPLNARQVRIEYDAAVGKRRHMLDHCVEATVKLRERGGARRQWAVVLRAYDDGVAFRYQFPAQQGWKSLEIADERTEFAFPADAAALCLPLNSFTTSFEARYEHKLVSQIPKEWLIGLPALVECPGAGWAGITEANLKDYAGTYLAASGGAEGALRSRLSPLPDNPKVAVKALLPHDSPWRVVLIGHTAGSLLQSNLVFNLSEPCALADTSWIHPGKTTFPWWNDYYLENVPFRPGLNTATMKYCIDFCAEAGIPYHSLDGYQNIGWYGCKIIPHTPADITKAVPEIDMPEILRFAKQKGVKLRLWLYWEDVFKSDVDRVFALYRSWGIDGVMLDFMNRDDQEMVNFLREVVAKAAANHLTVTFHGVCKPTGLERTYPNLLTSESCLNLEYDKWDPLGCSPEHQLNVAYARMLAGPLDFHQGSLRGVPVDQFKPRNTAPLVMGTPGFMLATYIVYENHLPMVADYPSAYRGNPALPLLAAIPCKWDDTRFLEGEVGKYIVMARRSGNDWWIGAMNAGPARTIELPLSFLSGSKYNAEVYTDDPQWQTTHTVTRQVSQVGARNVLRLKLDSAGGFVAWLRAP